MKMTFTAAGDMLVQRRIHRESDGFADVSGFLRKADVRYINLETTLHRGEFYANQFSGGSYLRADPETLEDVKAYAAEKGWTSAQFNAERFVDFYASKGWMVGRDTMKDWRAAARGWVSRSGAPSAGAPHNPALDYQQRTYKDDDFGDDFFVDLDKYGEGGR